MIRFARKRSADKASASDNPIRADASRTLAKFKTDSETPRPSHNGESSDSAKTIRASSNSRRKKFSSAARSVALPGRPRARPPDADAISKTTSHPFSPPLSPASNPMTDARSSASASWRFSERQKFHGRHFSAPCKSGDKSATANPHRRSKAMPRPGINSAESSASPPSDFTG